MAHEQQASTSVLFRISGMVRRNLPWCLLACYVIAAFLPSPVSLNKWSPPDFLPNVLRPHLPQLLVAMLLFLAAMGAELRRLPLVTQRPALLLSSLAAVWIAPSLVVLAAQWLLPLGIDAATAAPLLVGFSLVAAMPVANSSAAWTQQSRGELPWALSLVVLSIVVCPWMIPLVMWGLGLPFTAMQSEEMVQLMDTFTGAKFLIWVLLPTFLGMIVRRLVGPERVTKYRESVLLLSTVSLLLLNYINASVSLPEIVSDFNWFLLVPIFAIALLMCFAGLGAARLLGFTLGVDPRAVTAIDYALSMKNTGLAIALASDVLKQSQSLILPMFAVTLVQHLFAGALHRRAVQRGIVNQDSQFYVAPESSTN